MRIRQTEKKNRKERKEVNEGERITVDRTWRKRESWKRADNWRVERDENERRSRTISDLVYVLCAVAKGACNGPYTRLSRSQSDREIGQIVWELSSFRFGLNVRGRPAGRVVDVSGFLVARVSSSYREDESDTELLELAIREELLNRFYEDALANNKRESILDSIYIHILICILTCTDDIRFVYYELLSLLNIATCPQFRQNATDKGRYQLVN